ncbi:MAG: carbohydrate kinase [Chloroflexota bacterium]
MPTIIVLGEALIDIFAEKGVPLRQAKSLYPTPGGAPANVAVALARLGADVGFVGKVGVDDYGDFLIDLLKHEGVDITYFTADPNGPTMLAVVAMPSATEQHFILYNGANTLLKTEELSPDYFDAANIYIYSSVTLAEASRTAALDVARWMLAAGKQVIFDVNLRPLVWPNMDIARERIEKSVELSTILKLNEIELEFLTGTTDPAIGSQQLLSQGVQLCCVSLGAEGAYFNNGSAAGHVAPFNVSVQDTTGSGDAFVAGLAYQLLHADTQISSLDEQTLQQIIRFANACGALAATQIGGMSASPTLAAVNQLQTSA